jgi:hypothetical protein
MKRLKCALVVATVLLVSGCGVQETARVKRIPFPDEEYKALPKSGTATVTGQAFLRQRGGGVVTAAGQDIALNPITSYSLNWFDIVSNGGRPEEPDERSFFYIRTVKADAEGRFKFENVATGAYFITTFVIWEVPSGRYGYMRAQGGCVSKRIQVKDGQDMEVIVTEVIGAI